MPASATSSCSERLVERLSSSDSGIRLKALRELKNQIIGNRTKKLFYVKLGAVPKVVEILASDDSDVSLLVQSAATLGSFACGVELGARAVITSGALAHLTRVLSYNDEKVVDACARSLRMIFQSKLAPKYDLLEQGSMNFLLALLNSDKDSIIELASTIIAHSCKTGLEQKALSDAGLLQKLIGLLSGNITQRDAALDSLAAVFKNNSELVSKLISFDNGRTLRPIIELLKDKFPRTRLLASVCLTVIWQVSSIHLQDVGIMASLMSVLIELLDEPGLPGDDAPFALADLVADKEDLQKLALGANAVKKLCSFLCKGSMQAKRLEGTFLALSVFCLNLENYRNQAIQSEVLEAIIDALMHELSEVRHAACICLRSVTRSIKNLSAGRFTDPKIVTPLVQLLCDPSTSVQTAAIGAMANILVDFSQQKDLFIQSGAIKELVQLSRSMDSGIRMNAACALRNSAFLADCISKHHIVSELTVSTLSSLICDPEPSVQEHAVGLLCNLVSGSLDSIDDIFAEDGLVIKAVVRQLGSSTRLEVCIQGMYVLSNIACGTELHKVTVMHYLLSLEASGRNLSLLTKCLQSDDSKLRIASVWCVVNLTYPNTSGSSICISRMREAGIISQIKSMANDPCLDVKFRVKTVLSQCTAFEIVSA